MVEAKVTESLFKELERLYPAQSTKTEITHAWSGLICNTEDENPIVGAIQEMPGQYLSLGYNGNGMVKAFSCGRHISELIAGLPLSCPLISEQYSPDRFKAED